MISFHLTTPIGNLLIILDNTFKLTRIALAERKKESYSKTPLEHPIIKIFSDYFQGKVIEISYPFSVQKLSCFEMKVLEIVRHIPYGNTETYGSIARKLNSSPRAVGQALKRNPLPIIIPCHRVVRTDGSIGGYSLGLEAKKWLIEHEKAILYKLR